MPGPHVPTLVALSLTTALLAALAIGLIARQLRLKTRLLEAELARPREERLDAVPAIDPVTGDVGDVILSLVDVTERRRIERALRESEERFRTMVDSLADGIVLQLADFSIATCNASAERITGLTADQMLGRAPRPEGWLAINEDGSRFDLRQ